MTAPDRLASTASCTAPYEHKFDNREAQVGDQEQPQQPQTGEPVPYSMLIPELEGALHRAVSENVILRARLAARDQRITALEGAAFRDQPPAGASMVSAAVQNGAHPHDA